MNLENAKSNICMAIGMIEGTEGSATAQAVGLLNGAIAALETTCDDGGTERTCGNCGKQLCNNLLHIGDDGNWNCYDLAPTPKAQGAEKGNNEH